MSWPSARASSERGTRSPSSIETSRSAGRRVGRLAGGRPTATSSTRCSGRSSTTPSSTGEAPSGSRSASSRGRRRGRGRGPLALDDDLRPGGRDSTTPTGTGSSGGSRAGRPVGPRAMAAALGLYVSRALIRGMGGDLVLDPPDTRSWRHLPPDAPRRAGRGGVARRSLGPPRGVSLSRVNGKAGPAQTDVLLLG